MADEREPVDLGYMSLPAGVQRDLEAGPRDGGWPEEARVLAVAVIDARISASLRVSAPCAMNLATDILNAVAPLIRAGERERIAALAEEHGAVYATCPCQPGAGDPAHADGSPALFADLIREPS